jgi:hypothetical protein
MSDDADIREQVAELEAEFWPLVHDGKYDTPEARELADRIHEMRARLRAEPKPDNQP